ncbi:TPA: hypothetical protein ACH3X2_012660 [Trebouxia sp. C0005]
MTDAKEDSTPLAGTAIAPVPVSNTSQGKSKLASMMQLPAWMSTFLKVDTAAVADMSAQFVPSSAAKDSALSAQHQLHTASRVKDPNETTEATGGDEPSTTTPGNLEGAGGVVPITTPAAELSATIVSATTSAADSLVDAALRANPPIAKRRRKETVERPIAGDLSSPDIEGNGA